MGPQAAAAGRAPAEGPGRRAPPRVKRRTRDAQRAPPGPRPAWTGAASAQAPGAGSAHLPLEPAHQSSRFRPRDDTHPLAFAGRLRGTDYILFILDLPQLFNYLIFQEKIGRGEGSKR